MIALDTNILALYLQRRCRASQGCRPSPARKQTFTAPLTVILELVWVLKVNGCAREEIAKGLRLLFGLPNFKPKQFEALCYALQWFEQGMDFGDALHLAQSAGEEGLCTFDKPLGKLAESLGAMPKVDVLRAQNPWSRVSPGRLWLACLNGLMQDRTPNPYQDFPQLIQQPGGILRNGFSFHPLNFRPD